MTRQLTLLLLVPLALLATVVAGCGGGSSTGSGSVPSDAVATVGDQTISKDQFDRLINQAKQSYKQQNKSFPSVGSPQYEQLKQQAVAFLVQRSEFDQKGDDLGISISTSQVDKRLEQIKKQYFKGNDAKYQAQLKKQGLTEAQVRSDLKAQLLSEAIFKGVTKDAKVSDADVQKYYDQHRSQYQTGESRDVRHILIACGSSSTTTTGSKKAKSCTAAKAQAEDIYKQLKNGGNFAALAKKYSDDPGSAAQGGKLTIQRGQTVATFDQTAFQLEKGTISQPIKTQYGYHIIQPISDIRKKKVTPYSQVKDSIRQQLLQQKKNSVMTKWVDSTKKDFDVHYQVGYAPQSTQQQ
jgi:parvulin-like peptidyl-prolyl isomerase